MYKLFVVEDENTIATSVAALTAPWGFEVEICSDFHRVLEEFTAFDPHIVLMDISLPFAGGYHWCTEIRKISKVPIVFLSSASDNMNVVMAMNMGGDDFIAKPFDGNVLIAKLQAVLRRAYDFAVSPVLSLGKALIHTGEQSVSCGERKVELSKNEYRILVCLLENKGAVVSREKLMERLWETDCFVDDNTLTVNVNRLRKALEPLGLSDCIKTKFGVGYMVIEP